MENGELMRNKGLYLQLLQEQLTVQSDLRSQHLDPEVYEAFYASEEAYDNYSLSRLLIESDESLNTEEKMSRLAQLDAQAPSDIVASRREASITDDLKARVEHIKENGGGREEVRAVRVEMFGEEAAERFDALDEERAQWQARLDNYLKQRGEILSLEGLTIEERQAQVDSLRESQFDSREQIRVKVYERKADA
jgi:lipase chaperone LimK